MVRFSSSNARLLRRRAFDLVAGAAFGVAATLVGQAVLGAGAEAPVLTEGAFEAGGVAGPALGATALSVIDGDTFEARVSAFPGQEIVARVRLDGVDAPERRGRCAAETRAAEEATRALRSLVEGRRLTLTAVRGDKYFGRVVARVSGAGVGDLAQALVAGGHGRAYAGGRRDGWC